MATPVYSDVFFREAGLQGEIYYQVPDNYTAVIRCADVYTANENLTVTTFRLRFAPAYGTVFLLEWGETTPGSWKQWQGRQVFHQRETFSAQVVGFPCDVNVSGFLLANVGP